METMKSSGPDRRAREAQRREPRAATAARTPKAGQTGGPFSSEDPQRMISTGPRRAKPRRDEAEENFAEVHDPEGVRLQKVLAQAGVASRRVCEALISEGRVAVDGKVIIEPGIRVQPEKVAIHVDGVRIQLSVEHQYVMFNKPAGVVTTMSDPHGRPCINDYLTEEMKAARLFHVGRLDAETEGLLLLTNDGELANRLTHPSYEVPKTYVVEVAGPVFKEVGKKLRAGIELEDGPIAVDDYRQLGSDGPAHHDPGDPALRAQPDRAPDLRPRRPPGAALGAHRPGRDHHRRPAAGHRAPAGPTRAGPPARADQPGCARQLRRRLPPR